MIYFLGRSSPRRVRPAPTGRARLEWAVPESPFAFTPAERVAFEMIVEGRPEVLTARRERPVPVVEELSRTCQGRVVTSLEAEDLPDRLREEFVGQMMAEMEPGGEDGDLRASVIDLLARHFLAKTRPLLAPKQN